jgi:hypothetical protein
MIPSESGSCLLFVRRSASHQCTAPYESHSSTTRPCEVSGPLDPINGGASFSGSTQRLQRAKAQCGGPFAPLSRVFVRRYHSLEGDLVMVQLCVRPFRYCAFISSVSFLLHHFTTPTVDNDGSHTSQH